MTLRMVVGNSLRFEGNLSCVELENWALHNTCFSHLLNSALAMCKSLSIPVFTAIKHLGKQKTNKETNPKTTKTQNTRWAVRRWKKIRRWRSLFCHFVESSLVAQAIWKCFPVKASSIAAASLAGKASLRWKQIPVFPWHWVAPATLQLSKNLSDSKEKLHLPWLFCSPFSNTNFIFYSQPSYSLQILQPILPRAWRHKAFTQCTTWELKHKMHENTQSLYGQSWIRSVNLPTPSWASTHLTYKS